MISDRYADSTFVYQGFVNKFGIKDTKKLHKDLLNNFYPDFTFLFNLNAKEIIKRLQKRKNKNKYDKTSINFHKSVISGYKKISNHKRYIQINGSSPKKEIHLKILKSLNI